MSKLAEGLARAAAEALRPFARRLISHGVPLGIVEANLRAMFVEIAVEELATSGGQPSDSRIALLTGIHRKEVKRLRNAIAEKASPVSARMGLLTGLVSRWMTDSRSSDGRGRPKPLPYQSQRGYSFVNLAREVTTDLAPRVLLDELLRTGAARLLDDDRVVLSTDSFVPRKGQLEQLQILAEDPAELVETMLRNVLDEEPDRLLQRKVIYDHLGRDGAARLRAEVRREGERFLRRLDRLLSRHDRDRNPKAPAGARYTAGVGLYFFESPPTRKSPPPRRARIRRRGKKR